MTLLRPHARRPHDPSEHEINGTLLGHSIYADVERRARTELVMHCDRQTRCRARASLFNCMEVFYNRQRRHSPLN